MLWVFSGIFYGFFMSLYTFINQKYKINGYVLGMWRGFGVAIISLPVFFLVPFEKNSVFYILLTLQGILTGLYDSSLFMATAKYGTRPTSKMLVFSVPLSLILTWVIRKGSFFVVWNKPVHFFIVILSVVGFMICYYKMLRKRVRKSLVFSIFPAVVAWSVMSSLTYEIMNYDNIAIGLIYYLTVAMLVSGIYNLFFYIWTEQGYLTWEYIKRDIFSERVMTVGLLLILFSSVLIIAKGIALAFAPNTAYVTMLSLTFPLWVMFFNYWIKSKEESSVQWGVGVLFFLFLMIGFTLF
ncbi:MAG: hypothetical protein J6U64_00355 [Alphaproteobacteria bacterium]|nr:hypothetical protein [Alphaproteobacteria bacterium]